MLTKSFSLRFLLAPLPGFELGDIAVDRVENAPQRHLVVLFDFLDRRPFKDQPVADDPGDVRPVHRRIAWRVVPGLDKVPGPVSRGLPGELEGHRVQGTADRAVPRRRPDFIEHDAQDSDRTGYGGR